MNKLLLSLFPVLLIGAAIAGPGRIESAADRSWEEFEGLLGWGDEAAAPEPHVTSIEKFCAVSDEWRDVSDLADGDPLDIVRTREWMDDHTDSLVELTPDDLRADLAEVLYGDSLVLDRLADHGDDWEQLDVRAWTGVLEVRQELAPIEESVRRARIEHCGLAPNSGYRAAARVSELNVRYGDSPAFRRALADLDARPAASAA